MNRPAKTIQGARTGWRLRAQEVKACATALLLVGALLPIMFSVPALLHAQQSGSPALQPTIPAPQPLLPAPPPESPAIDVGGGPPGELPVEPYKSNYFLLLSYDKEVTSPDDRLPREFKFQISIKKNLVEWRYLPAYFGYTQQSFWQVYDSENSSPFRESNYNPELFLDYDLTVLRERRLGWRMGIEHESNGQSGNDSRSWNRVYIKPSYHLGSLWFSLKAWARLKEKQKQPGADQSGDDNPYIENYLGTWEFQAYHPVAKYFDVSLLTRKRAPDGVPFYRLDLDYFLRNSIYARIQIVHGYGESLIDYDRKVSKIGIGFAFNAHESRDTRHRIQ